MSRKGLIIFLFMCPVSHVTCHTSSVTFHLSPVNNDNSHSHRTSPFQLPHHAKQAGSPRQNLQTQNIIYFVNFFNINFFFYSKKNCSLFCNFCDTLFHQKSPALLVLLSYRGDTQTGIVSIGRFSERGFLHEYQQIFNLAKEFQKTTGLQLNKTKP